MTINLEKG